MRSLTIEKKIQGTLGDAYVPAFGEEDTQVGVPEVEGRGLLSVAGDESAAVDEEQHRDWLVRGNRCRVGVEHIELRNADSERPSLSM